MLVMREIMNLPLRSIKECLRILCFLASTPITFVLILLYPFIKIKFIALFSDRIGHYAINTEMLLHHLDQKKSKHSTKYAFYTSEAPICNTQLHKMWKRVIPIFPLPKIAAYIDNSMSFILGDLYDDQSLKEFQEKYACYDMDGILQKFPPLLHFTDLELQQGRKLLSQLGVPDCTRFICLLSRDSTYLNKYFSDMDWLHHFFRDCDIKNFSKAALFLANKGFVVFRMGKAVAKAFDIQHPNIIDYANHPLRSDFADLYLSSHCEFFISTSSGLDAIPQIFRRPIMFVNVAPFRKQLTYWYPCELFIVKKVFDKGNGRFVSFKEIDNRLENTSGIRASFERLNWILIENTSDEILEAVAEMESTIFDATLKKKITLSILCLKRSSYFLCWLIVKY